jgi:hypothetical protein
MEGREHVDVICSRLNTIMVDEREKEDFHQNEDKDTWYF